MLFLFKYTIKEDVRHRDINDMKDLRDEKKKQK